MNGGLLMLLETLNWRGSGNHRKLSFARRAFYPIYFELFIVRTIVDKKFVFPYSCQ